MNTYKSVILATVILALALALTVPIVSGTFAMGIFSGVLLVEGVADVLATVYVLRLVIRDRRRPRSWLLLMLFTSTLLTTAGILPIAVLVALRFLGQPPLAGGLGLLITGMGLALAGAVPVMKAVLFLLVQHDPSADPSPDPAAIVGGEK